MPFEGTRWVPEIGTSPRCGTGPVDVMIHLLWSPVNGINHVHRLVHQSRLGKWLATGKWLMVKHSVPRGPFSEGVFASFAAFPPSPRPPHLPQADRSVEVCSWLRIGSQAVGKTPPAQRFRRRPKVRLFAFGKLSPRGSSKRVRVAHSRTNSLEMGRLF